MRNMISLEQLKRFSVQSNFKCCAASEFLNTVTIATSQGLFLTNQESSDNVNDKW